MSEEEKALQPTDPSCPKSKRLPWDGDESGYQFHKLYPDPTEEANPVNPKLSSSPSARPSLAVSPATSTTGKEQSTESCKYLADGKCKQYEGSLSEGRVVREEDCFK